MLLIVFSVAAAVVAVDQAVNLWATYVLQPQGDLRCGKGLPPDVSAVVPPSVCWTAPDGSSLPLRNRHSEALSGWCFGATDILWR